jgi:hypothetical protein
MIANNNIFIQLIVIIKRKIVSIDFMDKNFLLFIKFIFDNYIYIKLYQTNNHYYIFVLLIFDSYNGHFVIRDRGDECIALNKESGEGFR